MPRTFGDGVIHMSHCDAMVQVTDPLPEIVLSSSTEVETKIGKFIADNLVHDGATLQMGKQIEFIMLFDCYSNCIHNVLVYHIYRHQYCTTCMTFARFYIYILYEMESL